MKEPVLEHLQALGAPEWFCRRFFPHMFRGDDIPPATLREDREIEPGNLLQARLKRRKVQNKPRRKRRARVERYKLTPQEFATKAVAEALFLMKAHRAHKLADMDPLKCMKEMEKDEEKGVK
jgi:hypothetical protein